MKMTLKEIAQTLNQAARIRILSHKNPDGDTLGSAFALYHALCGMGKQAEVCCADPLPAKFSYMYAPILPMDGEPDLIVTVDIADVPLMGTALEGYADSIDVCIDHHKTNHMRAKQRYVDETAGSTCEIIYELLCEMNTTWSEKLVNALYTGVCTDTGCFKFSNTTARTHRIAAQLIEAGCSYERINRELFDTKSKGRIEVERAVLESMEFYFDNRLALVTVPLSLVDNSGIDASELDGVSAIPRQIEGVEIGVTMRERKEGGYKISVRTCTYADASAICALLGGGGHVRAAGCTIDAAAEPAKNLLLDTIAPLFAEKR